MFSPRSNTISSTSSDSRPVYPQYQMALSPNPSSGPDRRGRMTIQTTNSGTAARRLLRPIRRDLLRLVQQLVRTNTVAIPPHGNETPGQRILRDFLTARGVRPELYDTEFVVRSGHPLARTDRKYAGRKNLIARLSGSGRGRSLLLNG